MPEIGRIFSFSQNMRSLGTVKVSVNDSPKNPPRSLLRPFILCCLLLGLIGIAAGGTLWWWNNPEHEPVVLNTQEKSEIEERIYEPGAKSFTLTEREVNGLLNANTGLGKDVRIELVNEAVHARVRTELDPDFPVLGGRTVNARARFKISDAEGIVLDDVTVFGISLPNAWLGELKGKNLLDTLTGKLPRGIKTISITTGKLNVTLEE